MCIQALTNYSQTGGGWGGGINNALYTIVYCFHPFIIHNIVIKQRAYYILLRVIIAHKSKLRAKI